VGPVAEPDVDLYYERLLEPEQLRKQGKTARALAVALDLLELVPALIEETTRLYGRFDLSSIPPIEEGCVLAAILGDSDAFERIGGVVTEYLELAPWCEVIANGRTNMMLVAAIERQLAVAPGSIQSGLGRAVGCDGRQISRLVGYLIQAGRVSREVSGRSYALHLVG
jgi:hypothetical protein